MKRLLLTLLILTCLPLWGKEKPKPFTWPALPDAAAIEDAKTKKTFTGLVVLEKRCNLDIKSYTASPMGIRRDEFVRFLVVNEEGRRNASIDVNDDLSAKIELIEARTVAPDGTVTKADKNKDIHETEVSKFDDDDTISGLARVDFPAPEEGAVLDLHFVTYIEGARTFVTEPLTYSETPSLDTHFLIEIDGGYPGYGWSVLTLNSPSRGTKIANTEKGDVTVDIPFQAAVRSEPLSYPSVRRDPMLLCYIDFTSQEIRKNLPKGARQASQEMDFMGRIKSFSLEKSPFKPYWVKHLERNDELSKDFLRSKGDAKQIDVNAIAPKNLPLEERLRKLYEYAQGRLKYDYDNNSTDSLKALLKDGFTGTWQGTVFFSYLLQKAGIPYQKALTVSRYYVTYSPIITNARLFGLRDAVIVDIPDKGPLVLMPGYPGIPYGSLPRDYTYSLAFSLVGEETVRTDMTPMNDPGTDRVEYRYEADLTADGTLDGTVTLSEIGASAFSLRWWNMKREARLNSKEYQKKKAEDKLTKEEEKEVVEDRVESEFNLPGDQLTLDQFELVSAPMDTQTPVTVTCRIHGEGMAQPAQDRWLLYACPVLAGYSHPFTLTRRRTPIWYSRGGTYLLEGTVRLPEGAEILELPEPMEFVDGPDGTKITYSVEKVETESGIGIKTRIQYDQPWIVGINEYTKWRKYKSKLAEIGESRCLIRLPESEGDLE